MNNFFLQNQPSYSNPYAQQFSAYAQQLSAGNQSGGGTLLPPITQNTITLNLTQIQGFEPVKTFTDSTNTTWTLVKNASDSTVDIPDPSSIQIVDVWDHEFPNLKKKVYIYVVEGIRRPRVETEKPTRILYQWFALSFVPNFSYSMISKQEWLKANVYAASVEDSRYSKLYALCKCNPESVTETKTENRLIEVEELNAISSRPDADN